MISDHCPVGNHLHRGKYVISYPIENSARPARRCSTADCTWYSQISLTLLSHHPPHTFPSRFRTMHMPRCWEWPMTATDPADSGVSARMFVVGCGLSFERCFQSRSDVSNVRSCISSRASEWHAYTPGMASIPSDSTRLQPSPL